MTDPVAPDVGWRRVGVLRPFAIRDFRLLWFGMSVSLFGDGVFFVALYGRPTSSRRARERSPSSGSPGRARWSHCSWSAA